MERLGGALLESIHFRGAKPRVAMLLGPRGVGKTCLAQDLQKRRGSQGVCALWDDWQFRKKAMQSPYSVLDGHQPLLFKKTLALIDEFSKAPKCWDFVTDLFNAQSDKFDFIATSSYFAKLSLNNKRFIKSKCAIYRIHQFSLSELLKVGFTPKNASCDRVIKSILHSPPSVGSRGSTSLDFLIRLGGFPSPFMAQSEKAHAAWLLEQKEQLIHGDLREMTRINQLPGVEGLMDLIAPGSLLSLDSLRQRLGVNGATVRLWLGHLERLHHLFRLEPYAGRLSRTLRHAGKLYFWDWSQIEDPALRLENLTACALLRWCHFAQDWCGESLELRFVRDKERRDVPFLLTLAGRPRLLVAAALGETGPLGHLRYFSRRLKVPAVLAALARKEPGQDGDVKLLPAASFLAALP